jgi:hypothetical protein
MCLLRTRSVICWRVYSVSITAPTVLLQGTLNAVASGILVYNGIVDLLLPSFGCAATWSSA